MSSTPLPGLSALPQSITAPRFPPTSRYANTEIATYVDAAGRATPYLRRRLLPDPDTLAQIGTHTVQDGERLDTIAAAELGDPVLSWQLLDGNRALAPRDLLVIGRRLRITLPASIPGRPMLDRVRLTLLVGPAVPVPAPRSVLDALQTVSVTSQAGERSAFQLTFQLSARSPLHTLFLLTGGASIPLLRVIIVVTVNSVPEVLIDGVMTHHEVTPSADPSHPTLTVTGEDLTRVMDFIDFSGVPYPAMPPEARVAAILSKYAVFGVVPLVIPSVLLDVPIPIERIPRQQGTDLKYVTCLADRVGYVFYQEPGPAPGSSIGYWGPEIRIGLPQPALNLDMDAHSNVGAMSFRFDGSHAVQPVLYIHEPITKAVIPVPVPAATPLSPPLGLFPPVAQRIEPIEGTAKLSMLQAAAIALTKAAKSSDSVTGTGSLDVVRYGRVLKARRLVGVRGAGTAFDGLWFVKSVTSKLERGSFLQDFALVRNGLVSTVPRVPS